MTAQNISASVFQTSQSFSLPLFVLYIGTATVRRGLRHLCAGAHLCGALAASSPHIALPFIGKMYIYTKFSRNLHPIRVFLNVSRMFHTKLCSFKKITFFKRLKFQHFRVVAFYTFFHSSAEIPSYGSFYTKTVLKSAVLRVNIHFAFAISATPPAFAASFTFVTLNFRLTSLYARIIIM